MCAIIGRMKNKYTKLKAEAVKLRRQGLSYGDIQKKLNVSKSTLSSWLKLILLKPKQRERLYTKQIENLSKGSQSQRERRKREVKKILEAAEKEIKLPLSVNTFRLMGAALYWAEGSKGKRTQITNSDSRLIIFMVAWIDKFFNIKPKNLKARLNIYPQQNEKQIINFWSELLRIPVKNFGKSYIKPKNKGYRKNNLYYGTIRIEVPKSADICCRINGWINGALKEVDSRTNKLQNRWGNLRKVERPVNLK